jgi:hypothetical protein
MSIEIKDYAFNNKEILLSNAIYVLPSNYYTETDPLKYYYPSTLPNFLKLAKKERLAVEVVGQGSNYNLSEKRSGEWFAPLLLISSLYASQNPTAVSIAVNMVSAYLVTCLNGRKDSSVSLDVVVIKDENIKATMISYRGPINGLSEIKDVIQKAVSDKKKSE